MWAIEAVKKLECMLFYQDFLADFKFHPLSIRSMHVLEEDEFGKLQKRLIKGHCISIFYSLIDCHDNLFQVKKNEHSAK
jgi:hypothetical protein